MEDKIKYLPNEVQHKILGYSYQSQSEALLRDIRSFNIDLDIVKDMYFIHYNIYILHFDLCEFCNKIKKNSSYFNKLAYIKNLDFENYCHMLFRSGEIPKRARYGKEKETYRKVREIWGALDPELRTRFINNYILLDDLIL
tara:strand:+ start:69 stop:491 length:423 start_codon:yes stop_codon:yes gene_type:complete